MRPRTIDSRDARTAPTVEAVSDKKGARRYMDGNLHVGLAAVGASLAVGVIGAKASEAVGRNPGAATAVMVQSILAIAFAEAIVFYTLFLVR